MKGAASIPSVGEEEERAGGWRSALAGVLIGTAVGDALGLPMEGVGRRRQERLFPPPLRHRLVCGRGMVSDDTEHTLMVAEALLSHPADIVAFQKSLAWKFRWWLLALPAGVGLATLRAIVKLWLGISPDRSGVHSAGNGPAMRSALLGVFFAGNRELGRPFVRASTRLTHTDPRAEIGAQAVAEAAAWFAVGTGDQRELFEELQALSTDPEWCQIMQQVRRALERQITVAEFARELGQERGVSGYVFHTVPIALYAALRHDGDFAAALTAAIACGGDTDTVGAITGALAGAAVGAEGIPQEWRDGIFDWPRSLKLLERVAEQLGRQLEQEESVGSVPYCWAACPGRNFVFLLIVLFHGFRRLLPPY